MRSDSTLGIQIAGIAATVDNNRITRNKARGRGILI